MVSEYDTRVQMREVTLTTPATGLTGWGLTSINLQKMRIQGLPAHPYDPHALQVEGLIVSPDRSRDELLETFEKDRAASLAEWQTENVEQAELAEQRIQLLYCPVWRLRYIYAGRRYTMTVSGLDGTIMAGNAPENHVRGLVAMLLAGAVVALPVAGILKVIGPALTGAGMLLHLSLIHI